jgi:hypothetical protein
MESARGCDRSQPSRKLEWGKAVESIGIAGLGVELSSWRASGKVYNLDDERLYTDAERQYNGGADAE